jgi:hypothetical protein
MKIKKNKAPFKMKSPLKLTPQERYDRRIRRKNRMAEVSSHMHQSSLSKTKAPAGNFSAYGI